MLADVEDGGPAIKKHWVNVSCLLELTDRLPRWPVVIYKSGPAAGVLRDSIDLFLSVPSGKKVHEAMLIKHNTLGNAAVLLDQRRRRWSNITAALVHLHAFPAWAERLWPRVMGWEKCYMSHQRVWEVLCTAWKQKQPGEWWDGACDVGQALTRCLDVVHFDPDMSGSVVKIENEWRKYYPFNN